MYEKLKKIRKDYKLTNKDMANLLNLKTASAYGKKESGKVKITIDEAKAIASFFDEKVDNIF